MTERTSRSTDVDRPYLDSIMWTTLIGGAELPSTVVPVGRTPDGLPVGIQVIGGHFEDRTTLAVARVLEGLLGGYEPPPSDADRLIHTGRASFERAGLSLVGPSLISPWRPVPA